MIAVAEPAYTVIRACPLLKMGPEIKSILTTGLGVELTRSRSIQAELDATITRTD